MMNCSECYWCNANLKKMTCGNPESENYNKSFSKDKIENMGCNAGETKKAVDYKNMTAWEFASKYYM